MLAYGDFTLKDLVQKLERAFGDWPKGDARTISLPALTPPAKPRVLLVDRPGSVQTSLWLGGLGIERRNDDYFAVLVMNHILGGGPASRLFINLREDKGYTYGVYSYFNGSTIPRRDARHHRRAHAGHGRGHARADGRAAAHRQRAGVRSRS